jgi:hypothetical protein
MESEAFYKSSFQSRSISSTINGMRHSPRCLLVERLLSFVHIWHTRPCISTSSKSLPTLRLAFVFPFDDSGMKITKTSFWWDFFSRWITLRARSFVPVTNMVTRAVFVALGYVRERGGWKLFGLSLNSCTLSEGERSWTVKEFARGTVGRGRDEAEGLTGGWLSFNPVILKILVWIWSPVGMNSLIRVSVAGSAQKARFLAKRVVMWRSFGRMRSLKSRELWSFRQEEWCGLK